MLADPWRLAVGTLTAVPVKPPGTVDRTVAGRAMLLAPLAVLPLGAAVVAVGLAGLALDSPTLLVGLVAVAVLVLGTRALHVDGLSDTADGLTASYDSERSWAAMHTSTSGPAGGAAVVLVLGVQAVGLASLVGTWQGVLAAGALVCLSRAALWLTCRAGVPAARADSLGSTYAGTVPAVVAAGGWALVTVISAGLAAWVGLEWWRGLLGAVLGAGAVLLVVRRAVARLGGTSGDIYGAAIELCLAGLLIGLA